MKRDDIRAQVLPFVAAVAIIAAGFAWSSHTVSARAAALSAQKERIESLQAELADAKAKNQNALSAVVESASGVSHAREKADRDLAEQFLEDCATWDSYESYIRCRDRALIEYRIDKDSQFLTSYMAPIEMTTLLDGTEYNYIDAEGLNSRLYGFEDCLVSVDGDTYRHFAFVTFRTTSAGRSADTEAIMSYAVDGDGQIFDVEVENV